MNKFEKPDLSRMISKRKGKCICNICDGNEGVNVITFEYKNREWKCYVHDCGNIHWKYIRNNEIDDIFCWKDRRSKDVI